MARRSSLWVVVCLVGWLVLTFRYKFELGTIWLENSHCDKIQGFQIIPFPAAKGHCR